MKTDTLFYTLFQEFPRIFFELIGRLPEDSDRYDFTSVEVKQLAFRLDGLFLPKPTQQNQPFYLVEVQFQPDDNFYYRLFAELFLYLRQYQPPHPWRIVTIYPSRSVERAQDLQFEEILSLNRVTRIYLDELGEAAENSLGVGVVKLVIEAEATAGTLARRLIAQARQQLVDETTQRNFIDFIETIIIYKLPQKSREEIEEMLGLNELKQTKVYQEAFSEGKQEGKEEGRQEGRQEGKQEGRQEAKLSLIPRLVSLGMEVEAIAQLLELPLETVQAVIQATDSP